MKNVACILSLLLLLSSSLTACKKDADSSNHAPGANGFVTGKVTDARGDLLSGVKVVLEHTVWYNSYVETTTDATGSYKTALPAEPAGSWTAKAQLQRTAYGQTYVFDLDPDNVNPFTKDETVIRSFTWKLNGQRPTQGSYYGAHVDLYQMGTDVPMNEVKLVFTPFPGEDKLIDGSPAQTIERKVEDVAGTFMVKDIPIGKYMVKAVYPGKTLLLDNRHDDGEPTISKPVIFGKFGNLGETEYNIEFWLSE